MATSTTNIIAIDRACEDANTPSDDAFRRWADAALNDFEREAPLSPDLPWVSLRIVDEGESSALNHQWREKDTATNVLSFPSDVPGFLGDIVLCAPVISKEALEQNKAIEDHWAHMVVHGVLHLQGFLHDTDDEAKQMEAKEALILERFGIINPYQEP